MDDILQDFLAETTERLATIDQDILLLEKNGQDREALARIFRAAHNIKSSSGFLSLSRLQRLSHAMEAVLVPCREDVLAVTPLLATLLLSGFDRLRGILAVIAEKGVEPPGDDDDLVQSMACAARQESFTLPLATAVPEDTQVNTMRVDVAVLENLMALTGELVLIRNRIAQAGDLFDANGRPVSLQKLHFLISDMQTEVLKSRMQPVMQGWRALPRLLHDTAAAAGKQVRLIMSGSDTGLDRLVLEAIRAPIAHLLSNAVAHGIEAPEERRNAGKPAEGTVHLNAYYADGCVVIKMTDDGRGLDTQKIAAQAVAQGLVTTDALDRMAAADIWPFIFAGGFSTRQTADHLAGRGVGLDVVRSAVEKIGGTVQVESRDRRGASFILRLPLTLAIAPAIIVTVGGQRYALPQTSVSEMVRLESNVEQIGGQQVLRLRHQVIPLLMLADIFQLPPHVRHAPRKAVLLRGHKGLLALAVDDIDRAEDVVVKPLPEILQGTGCFLGSAVLASGAISLIIDANRLMEKYMPCVRATGQTPVLPEETVPEEEKISLLLFRPVRAEVLQALPLPDVHRLVDRAARVLVRDSDGARFLRLDQDKFIPLQGDDADAPHQAVVVSAGDGQQALAVAQVIDIITIGTSVLQTGDLERGIRHRFAWQDNMVELLDAGFYARQKTSETAKKGNVSRRVLLIDDSPFFCRLMRPLLQTAGYDVVSVENAAEALALCRRGEAFDAVISDIEMPGTSGLQLAAQIRALPKGQEIPLLAMSSYASPRDEERARAAGFDHFLHKFDSKSLMNALASVRGAA